MQMLPTAASFYLYPSVHSNNFVNKLTNFAKPQSNRLPQH